MLTDNELTVIPGTDMPATEMPNAKHSQESGGKISESSLAIDQTELDGLVGALTSPQKNGMKKVFPSKIKEVKHNGPLASNSPAILAAV